MDAQAAARLGDEIAHGFGVAAMVAGAVAGALIGAAVVAATAATGGLAAVILAGSIAAGGLSMFQIVKGLTTIFELPEPTTGVLIRGSFNVYVNSRNAMRAGDDVSATCSGLPLNHPLWPFPVLIAEGSATVYINGKPAARLQSKMVCGAHIKTGSQDTFIGGPTERVAFVLDLEEWLHTGLEALGLAALAGGLLLAAMLFALPEYHRTVHIPLIEFSLWASLAWWVAALLLVLFYPASAAIWRNSRTLRLIFGLLTIVPFFWGMVVLRSWHYDSNHYTGAMWLLYVMILVWGADSGAYLFGKMFGKHKLAPKVSPGKTWQGFIGGLFTSAVISWMFGMWANLDVTPSILLVCSVVAALASVLGDLTESMFKREAGIKDSGHMIPGHGGILDRIDSLTAAVPVFACLLLLVFRTI